MKYISLILLIALASSCKERSKGFIFDHLPGHWERVNEEAGKATYELWKKLDDQKYSGIAYTLQDNDTVFKEDLKIYKKENTWSLGVTV